MRIRTTANNAQAGEKTAHLEDCIPETEDSQVHEKQGGTVQQYVHLHRHSQAVHQAP
jgi:hypothetical protein